MTSKKIEELRARIGQLKQQISGLESGSIPVPLAVAEARIDAALDRAEEVGRRHLRDEAAETVQADREHLPRLVPTWRGSIDAEKVEGLLVLTARKVLRKELVDAAAAQIQAAGGAMTAEQQAARLAELQTELLDLEVTEHGEVEKARAAGQLIEHRADIDPAVLLGLT